MKQVLVLVATLAAATPALSQAPSPAPAAPAPAAPAADTPAAPASAASDPNEGGTTPAAGGVRALRASCRQEASSNGLRGPAKREAVSACVVRQRPDLAAREQCRTDGFGKGLRKEELHAFVKACVASRG